MREWRQKALSLHTVNGMHRCMEQAITGNKKKTARLYGMHQHMAQAITENKKKTAH